MTNLVNYVQFYKHFVPTDRRIVTSTYVDAMKEILIEYCLYNIWATDRLFAATMLMPPDSHHAPVVSSFGSIYDTWLHIWSGQYVWMQRILGADISQRPQKVFKGTMDELVANMRASSEQWLDYVKGATVDELMKPFEVLGMSGRTATFIPKDLVMQVMNHGTYHRGQIVTMMRQFGATEIPSTDWARFAEGGGKS